MDNNTATPTPRLYRLDVFAPLTTQQIESKAAHAQAQYLLAIKQYGRSPRQMHAAFIDQKGRVARATAQALAHRQAGVI